MRSTIQCKPTQQTHAASASLTVQMRASTRMVRPEGLAEGASAMAGLASTPRVIAQREQLQAAFGHAIERDAGPEEEELQMKAAPGVVQRKGPEGEELAQGRFSTVQRKGPKLDDLLQRTFDPIQRKRAQDEELQTKHGTPSEPSPQFQPETKPHANNTGLPDGLKSGIESLSGISLDNVNVHYNSSRPAQLNALAYTQGSDIHVALGQEHHLPHEAWHVVQQAQGRVKPTMQMKDGVPVNDDEGLEREADAMGTQALAHVTEQHAGRVRAARGNGPPVNADPALEWAADQITSGTANSPRHEPAPKRGGGAAAVPITGGGSRGSIQRMVVAHENKQHWVSTLTGGTYKSQAEARQAEAEFGLNKADFLKQRRESIAAVSQEPTQPQRETPAFKMLPKTPNVIKEHFEQKVRDQKSLGEWNVNAEGRSQGLVHLLDYAYARPSKLAVGDVNLTEAERALLKRTDRDALSGAELQQKLGADRFKALKKYLQNFGTAPNQTERDKEQAEAGDLRPVGVSEKEHNDRLAELASAKVQAAEKGRAFGLDKTNPQRIQERDAANARKTAAEEALEMHRRFVLARDVSKHGRLANIANAAGVGPFGRGKEIDEATRSIKDIVESQAKGQVPSTAPTRALPGYKKVNTPWKQTKRGFKKGSEWKEQEIQQTDLSHTASGEVTKGQLNIKLWGVLPRGGEGLPDDEKRKYLKISTAI